MSKGAPAKLKKVAVSLPFGLGSAEWETGPDVGASRESVGGLAIAVLSKWHPILQIW